MRIAAFDPGPTFCGYAFVDVPHKHRPGYVLDFKKVKVDSSLSEIVFPEDADMVAVEVPSGYIFGHARTKDLLQTGVVAGKIVQMARSRGFHVVEVSAAVWRRALLGKGRSSLTMDARVKEMLTKLVTNLPWTTNHCRDAISVALFAGYQ